MYKTQWNTWTWDAVFDPARQAWHASNWTWAQCRGKYP